MLSEAVFVGRGHSLPAAWRQQARHSQKRPDEDVRAHYRIVGLRYMIRRQVINPQVNA